MPAPFRTRIFAVAAKIETVSGVDSGPTFAADAVRVVGVPVLTRSFLEEGGRADVQTNQLLSAARATPGGALGTIDIVVEMFGKKNAAGVPMHDVFLRGAGMSRTIDATPLAEKVTYRTLDEAMETFTLLLNNGNTNFKLIGCSCNARREGTRLQPGRWTFSCRGISLAPTDGAIAALALPTGIPPIWRANTVLLGAPGAPEWGPASTEPLHARSFTLDLANTLTDDESAGAPDGIVSTLVTGRQVSLSMSVRRVSTTVFDPYDVAESSGVGDGASAVHDTRPQIKTGTAQYARETINGGYWEIVSPTDTDLAGMKGWDLSGILNSTNGPGGRELEIIYD